VLRQRDKKSWVPAFAGKSGGEGVHELTEGATRGGGRRKAMESASFWCVRWQCWWPPSLSAHRRMPPTRPSKPGCKPCGPRRSSAASRAQPSTSQSAASSPICRCRISCCRARRRRRAGRRNSSRRPPTISRNPPSRGWRRKAASLPKSNARRWLRSSNGSVCPAPSSSPFGVGKLTTAGKRIRAARYACSRPRPILAAARISSAKSFSSP
jgi:hypothetical protein